MAAKRKHWSRGMVDRNVADDEEELLVFGYSCKLFRDDEKALYIEQGKHLIPWMGDDRLMIDRYDGRGYLHDIEQYEAKPGKDVHEGLTEEEIKIETLCDEERYLALCKDMSEEEMYHEEEMKRLRMALASDGAYNEVNFTYDEEATKDSYDPSEPTDESGIDIAEEPFIAPPELAVPEGMEVPPTGKMNAIIEKTAVFVAQHGIQMEIVIKTKQSKNTQFSFMQFDHPLNPYYKHMIQFIKSGKYTPKPPQKSGTSKVVNGEDENTDDDDDEDYDGNYLHPSLTASKAAPIIPQAYTTSTYTDGYNYALNTAYASAAPIQSFNTGTQVQFQPSQRTNQADDWYSLLVKQLKDKVSKSHSSTNSPSNLTPPMGSGSPNATPIIQPEYIAADPNLTATQYPMYVMTDPSLPTPPGLEPVTLPSSQDQTLPPGIESATLQTSSTGSAYETDAHSANRVTNNYLLRESHILPPPPDVQPIIDKMASYVAKNGKDFETVVLSKGDKRFEFLHSWHEFHAYYLFKKSMYEQQLRRLERPNDSSDMDNISSAPISFSIKAKEPEAVPLEKRSALSLDENSDSDESPDKKREKNEHNEKRDDGGREAEKTEGSDRRTDDKRKQEDSSVPIIAAPEKPKRTRTEAMELRIAEDRFKDKLAAAAREKLASASREKQLQLERKRRAALFLTLLNKKDKTRSDEISTVIGPQLLPGMVPTSAPTTASSNSEEEITEYPPSEGSHSPREASLPTLRDMKSPPKSDSASPEKHLKDSSQKSSRQSQSRSRSRTPKYRKRKWQRRSRSRSRHRNRVHKRSRSRSHTKISKSKTPPAAYAVVRRSRSPSANRQTHRSRSRSREHSYKRSHANSPSRGRVDYRYRRSNSPAQYRSWRSRSRSASMNKLAISPKLPHRSRSRSKSSRSHSHHSHSQSKSSKKSKSSASEAKKSPSSSPVSEDDKKERIHVEVKSKSMSISPDGETDNKLTEKSDGS